MKLTKVGTLSVLTLLMMSSRVTQSLQNCPRRCRCDERHRTVYCQEQGLPVVPYGVPPNTKMLHMQDNDVINGPTVDDNLSQLTRLEKLNMYGNQLTAVPAGLPPSLKFMSLRNNRIRFIGKNSLQGLESLAEIYLDANNITNLGLSTLAFSDTIDLQVLVLTNNLLTSLPEGLPASLRVLRLDSNRITSISKSSLLHLNQLSLLDLSNNRINQNMIARGAMLPLTSMTSLALDVNQLTEIPPQLPPSLTELTMSQNKIQYIYSSDDVDDNDVMVGSLSSLRQLTTLDLSMNSLRSVQTASFANLRHLETASFHGNAWVCDCHLDYFKQWLILTSSVLSNEHDVRCQAPPRFSDVTLNSIDVEALKCGQQSLQSTSVTSQSVVVTWKHEEANPPYIEKRLLYGPLTCQNCSLDPRDVISDVTDLVEQYSLLDVTSQVLSDPENAAIEIDRLIPGTRYLVCYYVTEQKIADIGMNQCVDVSTNQLPPSSPPAHVTQQTTWPPLWIILVCCITILVVFICIIAVVILRQRRSLKHGGGHKRSSGARGNRDDFYFPEAYLPGYTYTPAPPSGSFGTNLSERTYMECGEADASLEFDVMIKPSDVTSPKHVVTSRYEDVTIESNPRLSLNPTPSTNHNATIQSRDDPYRDDDTSATMTSRLRHETGIFV